MYLEHKNTREEKNQHSPSSFKFFPVPPFPHSKVICHKAKKWLKKLRVIFSGACLTASHTENQRLYVIVAMPKLTNSIHYTKMEKELWTFTIKFT